MAVPVGAIQGIARIKDEISPKVRGMKGSIGTLAPVAAAAGAALSGFALAAGNEFERARATIAQGTGATGQALEGLTGSFRNLAGTIPGVGSPAVASAIADLNTHLGLTGTELEDVSRKALQAGVDTNRFGGLAKQMGLDAGGAAALLDDLTAASQSSGTSVDIMTNAVAKGSARWLAAGGDMEGLTATVVQAAHEFGPAGLRGAMSEILQEVDRGVLPAFQTLDQQLGETRGTVERTHQASVTFAERLGTIKDRAVAVIGPVGSMVGSVGGVASSALLAAPALAGMGLKLTAVAGAARTAWTALTGPVGLAVAIGVALVGAIVKAQGKLGELEKAIENFSELTEEEMMQAITDVDERINGLRADMELYGDVLGETSGEIADLEAKKADLIVQLNEARRRTRDMKDATEEATASLVVSTTAADDNKEALGRLARASEIAAGWIQDVRQETYELHREFEIARQEADLLNGMLADSETAFGGLGTKVDTEVTPAMQSFVDDALDGIRREIPEVARETETWGQKFDVTMTAVDNVSSALTRLTGNSFFGKVAGWIRLVSGLTGQFRSLASAARSALSALGAVRSGGAAGAAGGASGAAAGASGAGGASGIGAAGAVAGAAALTAATYGLGRLATGLIDRSASGRYSVEKTQARFPGAGRGGGSGRDSVSAGLDRDIVVQIDGEEVARATARHLPNVADEEGW